MVKCSSQNSLSRYYFFSISKFNIPLNPSRVLKIPLPILLISVKESHVPAPILLLEHPEALFLSISKVPIVAVTLLLGFQNPISLALSLSKSPPVGISILVGEGSAAVFSAFGIVALVFSSVCEVEVSFAMH